MSMDNDERQQRIAARAYEIYLARGGVEGLHEEDWSQAERELDAEDGEAFHDVGPNVPINSGGVGERAGEVMPDVDEPGEESRPLPPPGPSR